MGTRKSVLPWLAAAGCLAAALLGWKSLAQCRRTLAETESLAAALGERLGRTGGERATIEKALRDARAGLFHHPQLSRKEIEELAKQGLSPEKIVADLMRHSELIPLQGVLGGAFRFHDPRDIHVLTTKLVRAYPDDGHIAGWMLLEFASGEDAALSWKVLDAGLR